MQESHDSARPKDAASARRNFHDAVFWMILGVVILAASLSMDRLESQDINPYTIPGLVPGLLGIALMLLGGLLAIRSLREGPFVARREPRARDGENGGASAARLQLGFTLILCVGFVAGLLGHGLPFWLGGAIFVSASILASQYVRQKTTHQRLGLRQVATAITIGLGAGVGITLLFQTLFLVRLP
jgi:Tripartite tricarboxylate transporter TctB family